MLRNPKHQEKQVVALATYWYIPAVLLTLKCGRLRIAENKEKRDLANFEQLRIAEDCGRLRNCSSVRTQLYASESETKFYSFLYTVYLVSASATVYGTRTRYISI